MNIFRIIFQKLYKLPFKLYWFICQLLNTKSLHSIYKIKLTPNFSDQTFRFCLKGTYGYQFSNFLNNQKLPFIFLDIGANQGLFSLIAARNPLCRKAWAFEPVKSTYGMLIKNISLNKQFNKVQGIRCAISRSNLDQVIGITPNHSGGSSLMDDHHASITETIHCISGVDLNDIIEVIDDEQVLIKIDTEGYEPIVIAQLKLTHFWHRITHIYIEIDANRHADQDVVKFLICEGFCKVFRTSSASDHFDILMRRSH